MNQKPTYEELAQELEFTKAKLKAIFELIPAHIHILDPQFNLLDANIRPPLLQKLGIEKPEDIMGKKCYEVFKDRTTICPECNVEKCLISGKTETRLSTPEEDELVGLATKLYAAPIHNSEGEIIAIIELAMDITDLKKAEAQLIKLNGKLNELALRDELTGLYNRRAFNDRLAQEIALTQRHSHPLSLLIIDIDHFKQINDNFGHSVGDDVLRHLGQTLQHFTRFGDQASRYGGEEFCLILPNTDQNHAFQAAERLRLKIAQIDWQFCSITVSIGVASIPPLVCSQQDFVEAADQALYQAKNQGRDRVVAANNFTYE